MNKIIFLVLSFGIDLWYKITKKKEDTRKLKTQLKNWLFEQSSNEVKKASQLGLSMEDQRDKLKQESDKNKKEFNNDDVQP